MGAEIDNMRALGRRKENVELLKSNNWYTQDITLTSHNGQHPCGCQRELQVDSQTLTGRTGKISISENHFGWKRPWRSRSSTHLLHTLKDWDSTTSLGSLFHCLTTHEEIFTKLNLTGATSGSFLVSHCLPFEKRAESPHHNLHSVVAEHDGLSLQPPLLQTKQPQFPQQLLICLVLQPHHQLHCSSLHTLKHLLTSVTFW